jgi:hypothetical protein
MIGTARPSNVAINSAAVGLPRSRISLGRGYFRRGTLGQECTRRLERKQVGSDGRQNAQPSENLRLVITGMT